MKTSIACLMLLASMIVLPIRAATPTTQPDSPNDVTALKKQLEQVRAGLIQLKAENQQLRTQMSAFSSENDRLRNELDAGKLQLGSAYKLAPFTLTPPPQQPPDNNAKSFQFNGRTVYVEPITQGTGTIMGAITINPPKGRDLIDDRPAAK